MGACDHILVVVDPTPYSQPAVDRAIWLGQRLGARLELFICDYDQFLLSEQSFDPVALEKAKRRILDRDIRKLRLLAQSVRAQGLRVSVDARWNHPLDEGIICKAVEVRPSIVVKDTHYHPLLKRSIFSNTDWNLIRGCPAPLLLVKPRPISERPNVIAAVDPLHSHDKPAELDRIILSAANDISSEIDADLHVIHAFDPAPAIAAAADTIATPLASSVRVLTETLEKRHRAALQTLLEETSINSASSHVYQGGPQELLVRLAEQLEADLVVMGATSRSALKRVFVGSTAERVLDKLPCDVLVVKVSEVADRLAHRICTPGETANL